MVPTRCFVVFPPGSRELPPFPFTLSTIRALNAARRGNPPHDPGDFKWCATLFFPETWPPELIRDYLSKRHWQESLLEA